MNSLGFLENKSKKSCVLVEESIYDEFVRLFEEQVKDVGKVGDYTYFGVRVPLSNHISSLETCLKSVYFVDMFQGSIYCTPLE